MKAFPSNTNTILLNTNTILLLLVVLLCIGSYGANKENVRLKEENVRLKEEKVVIGGSDIEIWRRLGTAESAAKHWKKMAEVAQEEFFRGQKILFELNNELKRARKAEVKKTKESKEKRNPPPQGKIDEDLVKKWHRAKMAETIILLAHSIAWDIINWLFWADPLKDRPRKSKK